jgi:hypothetical protein
MAVSRSVQCPGLSAFVLGADKALLRSGSDTMDEKEEVPKIFANRVIRELVLHMICEGAELEPDEYMAIRVAFRKLGGNWESISGGDMEQFELLKGVVTAWGDEFNPKKKDVFV